MEEGMDATAKMINSVASEQDRDEIGALLGVAGKGLTKDMVMSLYGNENASGEISKEAIEQIFAPTGKTLDEVTETMGVSTEELVK
jgi:uncharacterized protein YidB (DUF937 family)